ncbi:hypothetical protein Trydic_g13569 [Trypoxylus dichotomus]
MPALVSALSATSPSISFVNTKMLLCYDDRKFEDKQAEKIGSEYSNASENLSVNESDGIAIDERIEWRTKVLKNKKLIDDSDIGSILGGKDGKVTEEDEEKEEETSTPKRSISKD